MFRKQWLSKEIKKDLNFIFKKLPSFNYPLHKKLLQKSYFSLSLIIILYVIAWVFNLVFIPIHLNLSSKVAIELLENRLSNLIAVFVLSISASLIILSYYQKKEEKIYTSILFKEIYFFPILTFVFSNTIIFGLISIFQGMLSERATAQLTSLGFFFFILSLVLVFILLFKVYKVVTSNYIRKAYVKQIILDMRNELEFELISALSRERYNKFFNKFNLKESYIFWFANKENESFRKINIPNKVIVKDINLKIAEKLLKKESKNKNYKIDGYFYSIGIGFPIWAGTDIFYLPKSFSSSFEKKAKGIFKFNKIDTELNESDDILQFKENLSIQLTNAVGLNDLVEIKLLLEDYEKINGEYLNFCKIINSNKSFSDKYNFEIESFQPDIIRRFSNDIFKSLSISLASHFKECTIQILNKILEILITVIQYANLGIFREYHIVITSYIYIIKDDVEYLGIFTDNFIPHLEHIIRYELDYKANDKQTLVELQNINKYYYLEFTIISTLYKAILDTRNLNKFTKTLDTFEWCTNINRKELHQINIDLMTTKAEKNIEKELSLSKIKDELELPKSYYFDILLGIYCWLYHLYRDNKIKLEDFNNFIKLIKLPVYECTTKQHIANYLRLKSKDSFLDWQHWGNEENYKLKKSFTPVLPSDWLTFGYLMIFIQLGAFNPERINEIEDRKEFDYINENIKRHIKELNSNFEHWKLALGIYSDKEKFESKTKLIQDFFDKLKEHHTRILLKNQISKNLSEEKINKFKISVFKRWDETGTIRGLCRYFNTLDLIEYSEKHFETASGINSIYPEYKQFFIEEDGTNIYGMDEIGREISSNEDLVFSHGLLSHATYIDFNGTIDVILKNVLEKRANESKKTDAILFGSNFNLFNRKLWENKKFVPYYQDKKYNLNGYEGIYDGVPIFSIYNDLLNNRIVFCDFGGSFRMEIAKDKNWYNDVLDMDINEVENEDVEKIFQDVLSIKGKYKWAYDKDGNLLEYEYIKDKIKGGIKIRVLERFKFNFIDSSKLEIVLLE